MTTLMDNRLSGSHGELRRFSIEEYHKMGEIGILGQGDELMQGVVVIRGTEKPWHWISDDFDSMVVAGILRQDERVELIEGEIVKSDPIGPWHRTTVARLNRLLIKLEDAIGTEHCILPESTILISNDVKRQPDIVVANGSLDDYYDRDPTPSDIKLLVEVSVSSLNRDQNEKSQLYAKMNISDYWIVNQAAKSIEVYREPSGSGYKSMQSYSLGESIPLPFAPHVSIKVADVITA